MAVAITTYACSEPLPSRSSRGIASRTTLVTRRTRDSTGVGTAASATIASTRSSSASSSAAVGAGGQHEPVGLLLTPAEQPADQVTERPPRARSVRAQRPRSRSSDPEATRSSCLRTRSR